MNTHSNLPVSTLNASQEIGLQWRLAIPIALTFLLNMGMSITDTVMVAGFGAHALTGIALASDSYSIVFYLGNGVIVGLAPFIAKAIARKEHSTVIHLWLIGFLLIIGISTVLVPVLWFVPLLFEVIGVDAKSADIGAQYQRIISFAVFPMLVVTLCRTYLTAQLNTRVILWITMAALPLNALLNIVCMHGLGNVRGLGAVGTGYSTLLVSALTAVLLLWTAWRRTPDKCFSLFIPPNWVSTVIAVLRTGIPIGIGSLGEVGLYLLSTVYVATVGTVDAVAHILVIRFAAVAYAIPLALSQTTTVRVAASSNSREHFIAVHAATRLAMISAILVCAGLLVSASSVSNLLLDGSVTGEQAARLAMWLIVILVIIEAFEIPALTATGVLRAHHDTRQPMFYLLFSYWIVSAPLGIFLVEVHSLGAAGIWLALLVGMVLSSALIILRLLRRGYASMPTLDWMRGAKLSRQQPDH